MNETAAIAAQFAKSMLFHTYSRTDCSKQTKTLYRLFNKLA